jgi:hypothetical protein
MDSGLIANCRPRVVLRTRYHRQPFTYWQSWDIKELLHHRYTTTNKHEDTELRTFSTCKTRAIPPTKALALSYRKEAGNKATGV